MCFVDIHTHTKSNRQDVIEILNVDVYNDAIPNSLFSIGLHPWNTKDVDKFYINEDVLNNPNCLAIGECGLDKLKGADLNKQINIFEQHIAISEKYKKPMILHCVKSFNEIIELHKKWVPKQTWIIHGFNGTSELTKSLLNQGFMLSIGRSILNSNTKIHKNINHISLNNMFLETDIKTNNLIDDIYLSVSKELNIDVDVLKSKILSNFKYIFSVK